MKTIIALMLACLLASARTNEYIIGSVTVRNGAVLIVVSPYDEFPPSICSGNTDDTSIPCHNAIERPVPAELR